MRIIVCPHDLAMGGSQINAIELASRMKDRGHEVVLYAPEGVLAAKIEAHGLTRIPSVTGTKLSWPWLRGLAKLVKCFKPDLIHTYEWAPSLSAGHGIRPWYNVPQLMTVLSMDVPDFLPFDIPLIVGTAELGEVVKHPERIEVIEPPIDTESNKSRDVLAARERIGAREGEIVVSIVCRMTEQLGKADGVIAAIGAVEELSNDFDIRLFVVGDGESLTRIKERATSANRAAEANPIGAASRAPDANRAAGASRVGEGASLGRTQAPSGSTVMSTEGRTLVEIVGEVEDPSDYYESSDIVVGMGSSALRAMSYSKPLIVQGENGFNKPLTPETIHEFLTVGFFGNGGRGSADVLPAMRQLAEDTDLRRKLGDWGRDLVVDRFSLDSATVRLEAIYHEAASVPARSRAVYVGLARSVFEYVKFHVSRAIRR